jgi:hypothetical protein
LIIDSASTIPIEFKAALIIVGAVFWFMIPQYSIKVVSFQISYSAYPSQIDEKCAPGYSKLSTTVGYQSVSVTEELL